MKFGLLGVHLHVFVKSLLSVKRFLVTCDLDSDHLEYNVTSSQYVQFRSVLIVLWLENVLARKSWICHDRHVHVYF